MSKEFDYTKVQHVTSVDQSDREVPYNLRQSGPTKVELLISTRVRKSPYWHLSMQAGCWRATVYNRIYHPRGYVKPEDGGAMVEYDAIVNHGLRLHHIQPLLHHLQVLHNLLGDKYDCIQLLSNNLPALINANKVTFLPLLKLIIQL